VEQLLAQRLFQPSDLHAERRLHDVELARRAGDVALLCEAQEILHLPEVHDPLSTLRGRLSLSVIECIKSNYLL